MSSTTLGDTYRSLQALRYKGIRAHAWNWEACGRVATIEEFVSFCLYQQTKN
jgi:hypothetical protein